LAYDRSNDFARAVADYTESIRLHPTGLKYTLRGRCYEMLGDHNKAIADFSEGNRLQSSATH
jgi:tetratricopeptide (TPR) repeat protein